MKLAAIYNVYDGEELLLGSIEQIRSFCHEIIIVYQTESNTGGVYDDNISVVSIAQATTTKYAPDFTRSPAENEAIKRQIGINIAKFHGNTHFMLMDCDEYYDPKQVKTAIETIEKEQYTATCCPIYTYYNQPEYQLTPMETYYVPFITSLEDWVQIDYNGRYPVLVDPTRRAGNLKKFHIFDKDVCVMHHYSYVRKDISRKLRNSSAIVNFKDVEGMIEQFNGWKLGDVMVHFTEYDIKEVDNLFNINL